MPPITPNAAPPADTPPPAAAGQQPPPAQGTPAPVPPAQPEPASPPRFFSAAPPPAEDSDGVDYKPDLSKLTPEVRAAVEAELGNIRKGFQSAYTPKFQAVAERERSYRELVDKVTDVLGRLPSQVAPVATGDPAANPLEQVAELRAEGRHDEADALILDVARQQADARLAPALEAQNRATLVSTFKETVSATVLGDPIVKAYEKDVRDTWDGTDPQMQLVRSIVLKSPENMRTLFPMVAHFVAVEKHAQALEKNFDERVTSEVKKRLDAEFARAGIVPTKLIESGPESRHTNEPTSDHRAAIGRAMNRLTSH